ncbi:unnamed protein product [Symbiodinium pilosum]|uniref:Uncharacterized protein n=1 Tax=Symbiodinium pilosum TaxID=2952 RepID=A0A812J0K8_SYMPI|nr:unnamed protein product [Symbiodinium pilosum]
MSWQCIRRQLQCMRQEGVRSWCQRWVDMHLIQPAREMTRQQMIVSAGVGFWGGLFPVPPCTMPATVFCITMYSAGVPKVQRFSLPMASVAVIINELSLPADLAMMPCFIMLGQTAYRSITGESLAPCSEVLKDLQAWRSNEMSSYTSQLPKCRNLYFGTSPQASDIVGVTGGPAEVLQFTSSV